MSGRPDDQRPAAPLTVREQLTFMQIIDHETNRGPRRLLDYWAWSEDLHPQGEKLLAEALQMLWRT